MYPAATTGETAETRELFWACFSCSYFASASFCRAAANSSSSFDATLMVSNNQGRSQIWLRLKSSRNSAKRRRIRNGDGNWFWRLVAEQSFIFVFSCCSAFIDCCCNDRMLLVRRCNPTQSNEHVFTLFARAGLFALACLFSLSVSPLLSSLDFSPRFSCRLTSQEEFSSNSHCFSVAAVVVFFVLLGFQLMQKAKSCWHCVWRKSKDWTKFISLMQALSGPNLTRGESKSNSLFRKVSLFLSFWFHLLLFLSSFFGRCRCLCGISLFLVLFCCGILLVLFGHRFAAADFRGDEWRDIAAVLRRRVRYRLSTMWWMQEKLVSSQKRVAEGRGRGRRRKRIESAEYRQSSMWREHGSWRRPWPIIILSELADPLLRFCVFFLPFASSPSSPLSAHPSGRTKDPWKAKLQVRQHAQHKRTFYFLEQLIIKHGLWQIITKIKETVRKKRRR